MLKPTYYNLLRKYEKSISQGNGVNGLVKQRLLREIDFHVSELSIKESNGEYISPQIEEKMERLVALSGKIYNHVPITEYDYKDTYTPTNISIMGLPLPLCILLVLFLVGWMVVK